MRLRKGLGCQWLLSSASVSSLACRCGGETRVGGGGGGSQVGVRFVPNAQGFHVITDIKPGGPVWKSASRENCSPEAYSYWRAPRAGARQYKYAKNSNLPQLPDCGATLRKHKRGVPLPGKELARHERINPICPAPCLLLLPRSAALPLPNLLWSAMREDNISIPSESSLPSPHHLSRLVSQSVSQNE